MTKLWISKLVAPMLNMPKQTIRMLHWRHTMVDGPESWISYQWLAFLNSVGRWQLIKSLAPSTIVWRQCDIQIGESFWQIDSLPQITIHSAPRHERSCFDNPNIKNISFLALYDFYWKSNNKLCLPTCLMLGFCFVYMKKRVVF